MTREEAAALDLYDTLADAIGLEGALAALRVLGGLRQVPTLRAVEMADARYRRLPALLTKNPRVPAGWLLQELRRGSRSGALDRLAPSTVWRWRRQIATSLDVQCPEREHHHVG